MMDAELLNSTTSKAQSAYRTISEVSEELDVPAHVLRFWETHFPQIKPSRMRGSRRYYRPEDVEFLRQVKMLLYKQGFTIKGAKQFLKQAPIMPSPEPTAQMPTKKHTKPNTQYIVSELRILKTMLATLV